MPFPSRSARSSALADRRGPQMRLLVPLVGLLVALAAALAGCGSSTGRTGPASTAALTPLPVTFPCAVQATAATTPSAPPVVYVALGASDGNGVGADHPATEGYIPLLIKRLPLGSRCLNTSISGATLHEALNSELPLAVRAHPTLVTVWLVGNDFSECAPLQQYGADLDTLLGTLQTATQARVFVANVPDMSLLPRFQNGALDAGPCFQGLSAGQIRALAAAWNDVIAAAVARHGATLVNLFSSDLASHPDFIASDGFHPSTAGYARLADIVWAQIQAHGGVPSGP